MGWWSDIVDVATSPLDAIGLGGSSSSTSGASKTASNISKSQWASISPLYTDFAQMMQELLSTGGISSQVPFINNAVEQSRIAASDSLKDLDARLAQMGLAGTPYGEQIRGGTQIQGMLDVAQTPFDIYSALLQMIPNFLTGSGSTIISGLNTAAQSDAAANASSNQMWGQVMQLLPALLAL